MIILVKNFSQQDVGRKKKKIPAEVHPRKKNYLYFLGRKSAGKKAPADVLPSFLILSMPDRHW